MATAKDIRKLQGALFEEWTAEFIGRNTRSFRKAQKLARLGRDQDRDEFFSAARDEMTNDQLHVLADRLERINQDHSKGEDIAAAQNRG